MLIDPFQNELSIEESAMVNPVNSVLMSEIKEQENKASPRSAVAAGNGTGSAAGTNLSQAVTVTISAANSEAAEISLLDYEAADKMLRETAELIRQNPEMAEFAQTGIPPHIVLSLFES